MDILAAVATGQGQPLVVENVALTEPQGDEVLVRVVATGICGSDFGLLAHGNLPWPVVLGHEGAGVVEKVGKGVTRLKPGDHVVMTTNSCGHCVKCLSGQPSYCGDFNAINMSGGHREDGSCTHSQHGKPIFGSFMGQSSFGAYALATERNAIKVPGDVPLEIIAPLGCGVQTGVAAVLNTLKAQPGKSLVVFGAGGVGLSALMGAVIAGCSPLIVVDTKPERLALAQELGATRVINAAQEDAAAVLQAEGGVDYVVEASGVAAVMEDAIKALATNGELVLVGVASRDRITIDQTALQIRGQMIRGSLMAGRDGVPAAFIPKLIDYWREGRLPVEKLIRFYGLSEINEAIADAKAGSTVKPVIRFDHAEQPQ